MSSWTRARTATAALVGLLIATVVIGSALTYGQMTEEHLATDWAYSTKDPYTGTPADHGIAKIAANGTIYAYESYGTGQLSDHTIFLVALDPNGTLLWRSPINSLPMPTIGPDGNLYYVDWPDVSVWRSNLSLAGIYNLTCLGADGKMRWSYNVDHGEISLLDVFPDGSAVAHFYYGKYNETTHYWDRLEDKVLRVSPQGQLLWSIDHPYENMTMTGHRADPNGTFVMEMTDFNWTYEIGIPADGGPVYLLKVGKYFLHGETTSLDGKVYYDVRNEFEDINTTVCSIYAQNATDGTLLWRGILSVGDNPDHNLPGSSWSSWGVFIDRDGYIYARGPTSGIYVLDKDGGFVWYDDNLTGNILATFPQGGILVGKDGHLLRVNSTGVQWEFSIGSTSDGFLQIVTVGPDGAIYTSQDHAVVKMETSTEPDWNANAYFVLAATVAVALGWVVWLYDVRRKSKK